MLTQNCTGLSNISIIVDSNQLVIEAVMDVTFPPKIMPLALRVLR